LGKNRTQSPDSLEQSRRRDTDLRYIRVAGRGLAQVGLTPEQTIGKTLAELFPPDAVAVVEGPYRRAFEGETVTIDVPLADRIFAVSAAPLDRVDGAVQTIVAVAQDITERVWAERDRRLVSAHVGMPAA